MRPRRSPHPPGWRHHAGPIEERRPATCVDMLAGVNRVMTTIVERTYPVIEPDDPSPTNPTEEEVWLLTARVAANESQRVEGDLLDPRLPAKNARVAGAARDQSIKVLGMTANQNTKGRVLGSSPGKATNQSAQARLTTDAVTPTIQAHRLWRRSPMPITIMPTEVSTSIVGS